MSTSEIELPASAGALALRIAGAVQQAPFTLYRFLQRRAISFPDWYFGTNYQDWVIAYWYLQARKNYTRAQTILKELPNTSLWIETELARANLEFRLGHWHASEVHFNNLLKNQAVQYNRYYCAQAQMGYGLLLEACGSIAEAKRNLSSALNVFSNVDDPALAARASLHLARLHAFGHSQDSNEASNYYRGALKFFEAVNDRISQTNCNHEYESACGQCLELAEEHFVARFPAEPLHWFRQWALRALPVTAAILIFIVGAVFIAVMIAEFLISQGGSILGISSTDIIQLIFWAVITPIIAVWLYPFIYSVIGLLIVRRRGDRLLDIKNHQPDTVVITEQGLQYLSGVGTTHSVKWNDSPVLYTIEFALWKRFIPLFSRMLIYSEQNSRDNPIEIAGITQGYDYLKRRILASGITQSDHRVSLFRNITTGAVLILSVITAIIAKEHGAVGATAESISESNNVIQLGFSAFMIALLLLVVFLIGGLSCWRLILNELSVRHLPVTGRSHQLTWMVICGILWWLALLLIIGQLLYQ